MNDRKQMTIIYCNLNNLIFNITKIRLPQAYVPLAGFGCLVQALLLYCFQNYLAFQYFDIERYSRNESCALN
jgi:hypothetical protein